MISRRDYLRTSFFFAALGATGRAFAQTNNNLEESDEGLFEHLILEEFGLPDVGDSYLVGNREGVEISQDGARLLSFEELAGFPTSLEESSLGFENSDDYFLSGETLTLLTERKLEFGRLETEFQWPSFDRSMDTHHLRKIGEPSAQPFELTPALLNRLALMNHFDLDRRFGEYITSRFTLFILRGCTLLEEFDKNGPVDSLWRPAISIHYSTPLHAKVYTSGLDRRGCVMGAWDRSTNLLVAIEANSIPTQDYATRTIPNKDAKDIDLSSVLPTGLYKYQLGQMSSHAGVFRNEDHYPVLRSPHDAHFNPFDEPSETGDSPNSAVWTFGNSHHIHATATGTSRSAGCTIINRDDNSWNMIRRALGIISDRNRLLVEDYSGESGSHVYLDQQKRPQQTFLGMLLTGAEAALAHQQGPDFDRACQRLRFGSGGSKFSNTVSEFQAATRDLAEQHEDLRVGAVQNLSVSGNFDANSAIAALMVNRKRLELAAETLIDHSSSIIELPPV